jgi:hypothetical protein
MCNIVVRGWNARFWRIRGLGRGGEVCGEGEKVVTDEVEGWCA